MAAAALHAIWAWSLQAALVIAAGVLAALVLRWRDDPRARLALWRLVLAATVGLPLFNVVLPARAFEAHTEPARLETIVTGLTSWTTGSPLLMSSGPGPLAILALLVSGIAVCACRLGTSARTLRRFAQRTDLELTVFEDLQRLIGTRARLIACPVIQPFTFGHRTPIVAVPERFADEPDCVQRAVLAHELTHVRRGDWLHAAVEELVRALLWFHPGVWWALGELRLAREEIVDRSAARAVGSRRAYMRTLVEFGARQDGRGSRAVAFLRHRQLARRIAALSKEVSMSRRLLVSSGLSAAFLIALAAHTARAAFPMTPVQQPATAEHAVDAGQPSALERQAFQVPKDAPPPRKIASVPFAYPEDVKPIVTSAVFAVRLVVDVDGTVAEARILTRKISGPAAPPDVLARAVERLSTSMLRSVRQWKYEPPAKAPLAMTITVSYDASEKDAPPPPPPPPPPAPGDGTVTRPVAINQPNPIYPADAIRARVEGVVMTSVTVGSDGLVKDARIVKSIPALDQAALDAVRQWTFQPATRNGQPVEVKVDLALEFRLRN